MADHRPDESGATMIVFAPAGLPEVDEGADLVGMITAAVAAHEQGPLRPGDVCIVTSKIISKSQGRRRPAAELPAALAEEVVRTVARRGPVTIVESRLGLVHPAAGIDSSNVEVGEILLLPLDPDAAAADLAAGLSAAVGGPVGVVITDTSGRVWRLGQTDLALGSAQVQVLAPYAGVHDAYGNELRVTTVGLADELAAAGDLVKRKIAGRPVAVVRGLAGLVGPTTQTAADLRRPSREDFFAHGSREAVLSALLIAAGTPERLEAVIALDEPDEITAAITAGTALTEGQRALLGEVVRAALEPGGPSSSG